MVADDFTAFFTKKLTSRRIAADERRWAMSVWLLALLSAIAWAGIFAAGMLIHNLVF